MAYQTSQASGGLVQQQQLDLMKKQQEFDQSKRSPLTDIFDVLKQGLSLASDISGVAVNMAKIDEAKANMAGVQAQTKLKQQEAETQARLGRGEYLSEQELFSKGGTLVKGPLLPGQVSFKAKIAGQERDIAMLNKDVAGVEQKQQEIKLQSDEIQRKIKEDDAKRADAAEKSLKEIKEKDFKNSNDIISLRGKDKSIQDARLAATNMGRLDQLINRAIEINNDPKLTNKSLLLNPLENEIVVALKQVGAPTSAVNAGEAAAFKSNAWATKFLGGIFGQYNALENFSVAQLQALKETGKLQYESFVNQAEKVDSALELKARRAGVNVDELGLYDYKTFEVPKKTEDKKKDKDLPPNQMVTNSDYLKAVDWLNKGKIGSPIVPAKSIPQTVNRPRITGPGIVTGGR